jgi:hypothetical protein
MTLRALYESFKKKVHDLKKLSTILIILEDTDFIIRESKSFSN